MVGFIFHMETPVTTYKDISTRYGEFEDAKVVHFRKLQSEASQLCHRYEKSLALERDFWHEPQGGTHHYVQFGRIGNDGKFQSCDQFSLIGKGEDLSVDFAIRLTLEKAPTLFPKVGYVIPINVRSAEQAIRFKLIGSGHEFEISPGAGEQQYDAICSAISQDVLQGFDPKVFHTGQVHR